MSENRTPEPQQDSSHPPGRGDAPPRGPRAVEQPTGRPQASVTTLLRDLAHDTAELTRKEVALARGEISNAISELKTASVSMAAGGGVLYAGLLFLLGAATLGLATVMDLWLSALIVGAVVTLIGFIMIKSGQRHFHPEQFRPDRTANAMRKDREAMDRSHR